MLSLIVSGNYLATQFIHEVINLTRSKRQLWAFALVCGLPVTVLTLGAYGLLLFAMFEVTHWLSFESSFVLMAAVIAAHSLFQYWKLVFRTMNSKPFKFSLGYRLGIAGGIISMIPLLFFAPPLLLSVVPMIFSAKRMIQIQLNHFGDVAATPN